MMTTETETPAWIVPGTPVLAISGRDGQNVTQTEIAKVHKRYFTVAHRAYSDSRFSLDRQEARSRDVWSMHPLVVPIDSPRGREALEGARRRRLVNLALTACTDWERKQSRGNRLALIAALQAVEEE